MISCVYVFISFCLVGVQTQENEETQSLLVFSNLNTDSVGSISVPRTDITRELPDGSVGTPYGMTFDSFNNTFYVIDNSDDSIKSFKLGDPASLHTVINLPSGSYRGIAIDTIRKQLFVTKLVDDIIYRVSSNGTGLVEWGTAYHAYDVAVHSQLGWIYWTEYSNGRIMRAPVTDPAAIQVFAGGISEPHGLYIDMQANTLYWCGRRADKIEESSFDGKNRNTLVELPSDYKYYMTGLNGHVYISARNMRGSIYDIYNGTYSKLTLNEDIDPRGIIAIQDVTIGQTTEATTTSMDQQNTATVVSTATIDSDITISSSTEIDDPPTESTFSVAFTIDPLGKTTVASTVTFFGKDLITDGLTSTDTTSHQATTKNQNKDSSLSNPQYLGLIIGGVLLTVIVICVTVIVVVIIIIRHKTPTAKNNDTGNYYNTTSGVLAQTELSRCNDQHKTTENPEISNHEYMEILENMPHVPNRANANQNLGDYEEPVSNLYESTAPGNRNTYIVAYSTLKTDNYL